MAQYDSETLRHRVAGMVSFDSYQGGKLWYMARDGWTFPVPCDDLGSATVNNIEKGASLMRWIRKHMENEVQLREEAARRLKATAV